jgi:hypothetical protein
VGGALPPLVLLKALEQRLVGGKVSLRAVDDGIHAGYVWGAGT